MSKANETCEVCSPAMQARPPGAVAPAEVSFCLSMGQVRISAAQMRGKKASEGASGDGGPDTRSNSVLQRVVGTEGLTDSGNGMEPASWWQDRAGLEVNLGVGK